MKKESLNTNKKDIVINIMCLIGALIFTLFIWHKFLASGNSIIFIALLYPSFLTLKKTIENIDGRKARIIGITSTIFSIIEVLCTSINYNYSLDYVLNKWLPINLIGYFIISWIIMSVFFKIYEKVEEKSVNFEFGKISNKNKFLIFLALILIARIPYFLTYHPGLLTSDSITQVEESLGITEISNHHPLFSTAIISVFINIGVSWFNNINVGVALFSIFQMLIMSIIFALVLMYLEKKNSNKYVLIGLLLYYMFYPIHGLFSVTMWKDILFAGIIPIFILNTIELINNTDGYLSKVNNYFLYIIFSIFLIYSRNNGLYVFMLTVPFIAIYLRKKWRKIVPLFVSIIVLYLCIDIVLFGILKIKKSQPGEALSIPIQQIARTEKYNRETLTDEQKEKINRFFKVENIGDRYKEVISDPVKSEFNNEYYKEHKGEFYSLWFELLGPHFKDYVESFLSNSFGYYYPAASYWVANRTLEKNELGIVQSSITEGKIVRKVDSLIEKREIPIISMMFSIGFAFWLIIWNLAYVILKKEYKFIIIYIPILVLWLTLIASPVFCEFRYAYPFFTTIPIFIGLNTIEKENMKGKKDE